jgi:Cft2 family RNA processing exonuclease
MLFNEQDLEKSLKKIQLIDYHQELECKGIKFWCYNAGHVLGAAMFMVEIAGVKILYTGDFSRQPDRHLLGAETPTVSPDILIVEATYGIQVHEPRRDRELRFTSMCHEIVKRGGRCLIPVFALGRAQELLLILDEYWESHPELQNIPIYYASSLAKKCMTVFKTYINMMNKKIRKKFEISNPFSFKHISSLQNIDEFEDNGPCIIFSSPGMLQSGFSKQLFEMWVTNPKNGVIISGYCVEGTLAKKIQSEPLEVTLSNGMTVQRKMTVGTISFSAHSDREQTEEFIDSIQPPHVFLVHGDTTNCTRLKQDLLQRFADNDLKVYTPKNCEKTKIIFQGQKTAKVLGNLATQKPKDKEKVKGVLLQKDFQHHLIDSSELKLYADITCSGVIQNMKIPLDEISEKKLIKKIKKKKININGLKNNENDEDEIMIEKINNDEKKIEEDEKIEEKKIEEKKIEEKKIEEKKIENEIKIEKKIKIEEKEIENEIKIEEEKNNEIDFIYEEKKITVFEYWLKKLLKRFKKVTMNIEKKKNLNEVYVYLISDSIKMEIDPKKTTEATLFWSSSPSKDMIVDAICNFFFDEENETSSSESEGEFDNPKSEMRMLYSTYSSLKEHFNKVKIDIKKKEIEILSDLNEKAIISSSFTINCESKLLQNRLEIILKRILLTALPLPTFFCCEEHTHQGEN